MAEEAAQRGVEIVAFPNWPSRPTLRRPVTAAGAARCGRQALARLVNHAQTAAGHHRRPAPCHVDTFLQLRRRFHAGPCAGRRTQDLHPDYTEFTKTAGSHPAPAPRKRRSPSGAERRLRRRTSRSGSTARNSASKSYLRGPLDRHSAFVASLNGAKVIFNLSASPESVGKHAYLRQLVAQQSARTLAGRLLGRLRRIVHRSGIRRQRHRRRKRIGILRESGRFREEQLVVADIDIQRLEFERRRNTSSACTKGRRRTP